MGKNWIMAVDHTNLEGGSAASGVRGRTGRVRGEARGCRRGERDRWRERNRKSGLGLSDL